VPVLCSLHPPSTLFPYTTLFRSGLEAVRELRSAGLGHAAVHQHVDVIRADVLEDARVVRDEQDAQVAALLRGVDALGHDAQRVDVQAGDRLVNDREGRLELMQLQDTGALLLSSR